MNFEKNGRISIAAVLIIFVCISPVLYASPCCEGHAKQKPHPLFKTFKAEPIAKGAPRKSDVCLSSRWPRPKDANDPYDTFDICEKFHATRLEWVYTQDREFIARANKRGLDVMATLNATMPDVPGIEVYEKGRMVHPDGSLHVAPWMTWQPPPYMGCANSKEYKANMMARAKKILDAGARGLQFDDPYMNCHSRHWDICFCDYCNTGFRAYLKKKLSESELAELGIEDIDTFSYKAYRHGGGKSEQLKSHFVDYQTAVTLAYHRSIHNTLREQYGEEISFSSNNSSIRWDPPFDMFDYGMCELHHSLSFPKTMYQRMKLTYSLGKSQVVSFHNTTAAGRRIIGSLYALGANPLVPWDVWVKGTSRYYGKPAEFADLYGFVRANAQCFDGYSMVTVESFDIDDENGDLVSIEGGEIFAVLRAVPGFDKPLVLHLIDWSDPPAAFKLHIAEDQLPMSIKSVKLLRPVEYDRAKHADAEKSGDYSNLSKMVQVNITRKNGVITINVPTLDPWALLVFEL